MSNDEKFLLWLAGMGFLTVVSIIALLLMGAEPC